MSDSYSLALVLNAHLPFVRHPEYPRFLEERWLFDAILDTYLPLLRLFERLDADHVPFHLAISFSSTLCHMLRDSVLIERFLEYLDRRIEFGQHELQRTASDPGVAALAREYYERALDDRVLFTERYERDILRTFDYFHKKGRLELLTSAATFAYFPFYLAYPESIQAQIEVAVAAHRAVFGRNPQGFWLPELGWAPDLAEQLRAYNFSYTLVDAHGLVFADPPPDRGTFAPVRTKSGLLVLGRDHAAGRDVWDAENGYPADAAYRDFHRDIGYDLPSKDVEAFLESGGARMPTGFKYWAVGAAGQDKLPYDPLIARQRAQQHAHDFLEARVSRLSAAEKTTAEKGLSVCAYNADLFGHWWYEGPDFLEALFREAAVRDDLHFVTPMEYINKMDPASIQTVTPEFSSWGFNGYAETWLDSSNDWMYRHVLRSVERMIELAERFPDDAGLKERALNQAAREVLLAQASDWAGILHQRHSADYARSSVEGYIKNFITIYESLGSNYISTEWLTALERKHNIFPDINYRVFRKKR